MGSNGFMDSKPHSSCCHGHWPPARSSKSNFQKFWDLIIFNIMISVEAYRFRIGMYVCCKVVNLVTEVQNQKYSDRKFSLYKLLIVPRAYVLLT